MTLLTRDEQIERLLAPRRAHRRPPTPAWLARAKRIRDECAKRGIALGSLDPEQIAAAVPPFVGAASSFNIVVDQTAPGAPALALNGNAATTNDPTRNITAQLSTSDTPTTGYQVLIWGDVDPTANTSIQPTQAASAWITPASFPANQSVKLSAGDALKTINARIRDDVWNETATLTKTITLDTTLPTVNWTTGPDATKVSIVAGKRLINASFTVGAEAIVAWEVAVVANGASLRGSGTVIGTANGSTGVSGGALAANAVQAVQIDARDLVAASAGDGTKVVKLFVQDANNNWSS